MLDEEPLLSEHLLELAEWTAQYYLAPLGEVLRAMLPLTAEVRRTVYYRITDLGRDVLARRWTATPVEGNCGAWPRGGANSPAKIRTWSGACWSGWPRASR